MVMSWIFTVLVAVALVASVFTGKGAELAAAIPKGAQAGMTLAISLGGSICLWTGVGKVMEKAGFTAYLSRLLSPVLKKVFPSTKQDAALAGHIALHHKPAPQIGAAGVIVAIHKQQTGQRGADDLARVQKRVQRLLAGGQVHPIAAGFQLRLPLAGPADGDGHVARGGLDVEIGVLVVAAAAADGVHFGGQPHFFVFHGLNIFLL